MSHRELPPAERDVLACVHRHGQATARTIRETLASFRPMAHGSVMTLLKRLEAKGLVTYEKGNEGKAFIYRATQKPKATFGRVMKQMLERVFHGDSVALVTSLFETKPPTADQVKELERLLGELKKGKRK